MDSVLIYCELKSDNIVAPVALQLVSKVKEWNKKIQVCVISAQENYDKISNTLYSYGANEVIIVNSNNLYQYNSNIHPKIFTDIVKKYQPKIVLIGATSKGKEIASYCATKLETGLTADCTELQIDDNFNLISTRPTFGGTLTADILCKTTPQMATVQENTFIATQCDNTGTCIYENYQEENNLVEVVEIIKKQADINDINSSDIIVSVGKGACNKAAYDSVKLLAEKLNATIGGSRVAYEKGYITKSQQIGQTGNTVAPRLYIAIGISGANQHLVGIKNSGKIISINQDKFAPIFEHSDYGIVGDLNEIIPNLIEQLDS